MLLDANIKASIANALRCERIAAMRGTQVSTRNNHLGPDGIRRADIYVRVGE